MSKILPWHQSAVCCAKKTFMYFSDAMKIVMKIVIKIVIIMLHITKIANIKQLPNKSENF